MFAYVVDRGLCVFPQVFVLWAARRQCGMFVQQLSESATSPLRCRVRRLPGLQELQSRLQPAPGPGVAYA